MDQSNMIAQEIESHGVHTFSAKEMVFNILRLMHPILFSITQVEPVWGDLSGGFGRIVDPDRADMASRIRVNTNKKAELRRAIAHDNAAEFKIINGAEAARSSDCQYHTSGQFPFRSPLASWGTYYSVTFSIT